MTRIGGAFLMMAAVVAGCGQPTIVSPSPSQPLLASPSSLTSPSPSPVASPSALAYELMCAGVERSTCEALARSIVASQAKRVVSITVSSPKGDYHLTFDDGTGMARVVD
jgi:hypothetical protein